MEKAYGLYRKEMVLKSDNWVGFDITNDDDKEVFDTCCRKYHRMDPLPGEGDFSQIIEWDDCREDANAVFIDFAARFNDSKEEIKAFTCYSKIFFALYKNGYIKIYSRTKPDIDVGIIALMQII